MSDVEATEGAGSSAGSGDVAAAPAAGVRKLLAAVVIGAGVAACALYLALEWATVGALGLPLDDGWIHLTFARSLAEGEGMSYQQGRWVSGSTAPLWTAILSLGFVLPGGAVAWAKAFGVACYLLAGVTMARLARSFGLSGGLAWLAALLLVLTDWMVWGALSGMEIPLFVLLTVVGMDLQARESRAGWSSHWALPVLGLSALARPEGALLLALAIGERTVRVERRGAEVGMRAAPLAEWRRVAGASAIAVLAWLPFLVFSRLAQGSPLPSTFQAKLETGHKWLPALRDLWLTAEILFRPQPWAFLLAGAGAVALLRGAARPRSPGVLPLLWLLALPCVYSLLAPAGRSMPVGNFGRYLFPLFPPLILLGVAGAQALGPLAWRSWRWRGSRLPVPLLAAALLTVPVAAAALGGASRFARNVANVTESDVAAGRWIAARLPPDAVLGVQDVGAVAHFAPNPILDLVGIVSPELLARDGGGTPTHSRDLRWLATRVRERGVDFLVVFPESYGGEEVLGRLFPGLRPVARFPVRGNLTMAGSELVIYALGQP